MLIFLDSVALFHLARSQSYPSFILVLTSMATEDLLVYDGSNWEAVEAVCESFPEFDVEPTLACNTFRY